MPLHAIDRASLSTHSRGSEEDIDIANSASANLHLSKQEQQQQGPVMPRLAVGKSLARVLNESALDSSDFGAASSLELPIKMGTLTSDRIRRRSDVSRIRPLDSPSAVKPEVIELPVLNFAGQATSTATGTREADFVLREDVVPTSRLQDVKDKDLEVAASLASELVASVRAEDDVASTTHALSDTQKAVYKRRSLTHFLAMCWCVFGMGWNDGTTGPMLPRLQEHYKINFAIVSLIFVLCATGYICGALANVYLTDRFGLGKVLLIGALLQLVAYVIISPAGPFPLMCCAFALIGFGLSVQNAHANGFVASLRKHSKTKMGFLHGSYGFGALLSPLLSTEFSKSPTHWSYHYLISAGVYLSILIVLWVVFRGKRQEEILAEEGQLATEGDVIGSNKYRQILGLKEVHFLSAFALIYVGVEVTLGGWSVTYILEKRNGNASSGYISSGFFGGLMLGRILLMWLNKKIGERLALFIYALLAIILEITVWLVPSLIQNAIAVSFVGLLLGPMYPILMNQSTTILPRWLLTGCMGYIAGIGQTGSAFLPFVSGLLASKFGIASLQPFVVSMMSTLIVIWALIPRARYIPT